MKNFLIVIWSFNFGMLLMMGISEYQLSKGYQNSVIDGKYECYKEEK